MVPSYTDNYAEVVVCFSNRTLRRSYDHARGNRVVCCWVDQDEAARLPVTAVRIEKYGSRRLDLHRTNVVDAQHFGSAFGHGVDINDRFHHNFGAGDLCSVLQQITVPRGQRPLRKPNQLRSEVASAERQILRIHQNVPTTDIEFVFDGKRYRLRCNRLL